MGWGVLLVAVVLIFGLAPHVSRVRALASLRFPSRVERRPAPIRLQAAVDDILQPVEAELAALGFSFSHAVDLRGTPRALSPWQPVRVYRHGHYPLIAQLMAPGPAELPNMHVLIMLAQVREGLMVATANLPWSLLPPDPLVCRAAGDAFATVKDQFDAQLGAMHCEGMPDFVPWGQPEEIEARLTQYESRMADASVEQGWCRPDGEALAVVPKRLPALAARVAGNLRRLRSVLRQLPPDSTMLKATAPLERSLLIFVAGKAVPKASPAPEVQWLLYVGSCLLFLVLGTAVFGWAFAWVLLVVVALHEAGHYLAMRALGYRHTQMLMLPLVGGVAFGEEARPNAWHRTLVSLAGPVPGLLLGLALLWIAPQEPALALLAWVMVFINALNLLPFQPLDGGHVLEALLPWRHAVVRIVLEAVALAGLAALWWLLDAEIALLLAVLRVLTWRTLWRQVQFEQRYRRAAARAKPPDAKALARLSFQLLEQLLPQRTSLAQRIRMVDGLIEHLRYKPMKGARAVVVAAVYVGILALPVLAAPQIAHLIGVTLLSDEERRARALAESEQRLRQMTLAQLVRAVESRADAPAPASELALQSLAQRTGNALPQDVRELYLTADGLQTSAGLEWFAAADVRPLGENRPRLASVLARQLQESRPRQPTRVAMACAQDAERDCGPTIDAMMRWTQVGMLTGRPLVLHPERPDGAWRLVQLDAEEVRLTPVPPLRQLLESQPPGARATQPQQR